MSMGNNFRNKNSQFFQPTFQNASVRIQGCIGPNGVDKLEQCDQRINATCSASLLQENLTERISNIYKNQAKNSFSAS